MRKKVALITGVTGQDGSYLAEFLLKKDYVVHGMVRRNSDFMTKRIDHLWLRKDFITHHGDVTDSTNIHQILQKTQPDEIYNLAAQSHVSVSFETPEYSSEVSGLSTLKILAAMKSITPKARFYQASTSELFGGFPETVPQSEKTPFAPQSPYATAKLFAYWMTKNYRDAYGLFACNGILFNHESPRRGRTFLTKKVSMGVAAIHKGGLAHLTLGNLDAKRDWGYAKEYVEAMWLMLQQPTAEDFVIGTGVTTSVRQFVEYCFEEIGIKIQWRGEGLNEVGIDPKSAQTVVRIDAHYNRPLEVDILKANVNKATKKLGWTAKMDVKKLAKMMVNYDLSHKEYGFSDE